MKLTGLWLVSIAFLLTVGVSVATVRLWGTGGRRRPPVRIAGLLLVEALAVLSAGLVANRADDFYPSWQALTGDLGAVAATAAQQSGSLDGRLAAARAGLAWTWPGGAARLVAPAGYRRDTDLAYPVIVVLTASLPSPQVPGAVLLILSPGPATTAAELATLPDRLRHDARVTGDGWAVVADPRYADLAARWRLLAPQQVGSVTVADARHGAATVVRQLPAPLAPPARLPS